jgi:UDP-glucose 4-epimerase
MRIEGSSILVTGGAGFIGSHIVDSLVNLGARVRVYDNFSFGSYENLKHLGDRIEIVKGDILNYDALLQAMRGVDFVSHHAAQLEIFRSTKDPYDDLQVNTVGTLNVLLAAKECGVKKLINASSACIYGQVDGLTHEMHYPRPNWPYGVSKLAAEKYGDIYNDYHELPVVSFRYGITYGEREWFRRVLTIFIKRAILGLPLVVFGDGSQVRDFIYVGDVVRLHNICLENERANGQAYNVGTGTATTIAQLAQEVIKASNKNLELIYENTPEGEFSKLVPDKKRNDAELKVMLLDITKAQTELGWQPTTSLFEGLQREILWATENIHRWEKVLYTVV